MIKVDSQKKDQSTFSMLKFNKGDDNMGETINLVNIFKVEKVIFNCGEYNN